MTTSARRRRGARALLTVAQAGQAALLFGNLYEAVVKIPHRFAHHRDLAMPEDEPAHLRSLLRPGSPTLYFVPSGPVTVVAALAALGTGWDGPLDRRWLTASASATALMALLTAYVVRQINFPLFFSPQPPSAAERDVLLRRWYRLNAIRIAASSIAWASAQRARSSSR